MTKLTVKKVYDNSVRVLMEKPSLIAGVPNRESVFMASDGTLEVDQVIEVPDNITVLHNMSTSVDEETGVVSEFKWIRFESK